MVWLYFPPNASTKPHSTTAWSRSVATRIQEWYDVISDAIWMRIRNSWKWKVCLCPGPTLQLGRLRQQLVVTNVAQPFLLRCRASHSPLSQEVKFIGLTIPVFCLVLVHFINFVNCFSLSPESSFQQLAIKMNFILYNNKRSRTV